MTNIRLQFPETIMRIRSLISLLFLPAAALAADDYRAEWTVALEAGVDSARVTLALEDAAPVERVTFAYDPERFEDFSATSGELDVDDARVTWEPGRKDASLSYRVKITRARENSNQEESYDALMTGGGRLKPSPTDRPQPSAVPVPVDADEPQDPPEEPSA